MIHLQWICRLPRHALSSDKLYLLEGDVVLVRAEGVEEAGRIVTLGEGQTESSKQADAQSHPRGVTEQDERFQCFQKVASDGDLFGAHTPYAVISAQSSVNTGAKE